MKHLKILSNICVIFILNKYAASVAIDKWHKMDDFPLFYIENEIKFNWFQAWNECSARNMSLVAVDTLEKNSALVKILRNKFEKRFNVWIGGNDLGENGMFTWYSTGRGFEFTNWSKGNPDHNNGVEHCVHYYDRTEYEWNDANCAHKMGFICEENRFLGDMRKSLAVKKNFIDQLFLI